MPVLCGNHERAFALVAGCHEKVLLVNPIANPAVPVGKSRLRTIVSAAFTEKNVDFAVEVPAKVGRRVGVI
ncbi:MAG: hypothetical protein HZA53_14155 [Planctomycetes bacterium]|nr:hypothetical protein [Planctomycetota bacterium]